MGDTHRWKKLSADSWQCIHCRCIKEKRPYHAATSFARYNYYRQDGSRLGHSAPHECQQRLKLIEEV